MTRKLCLIIGMVYAIFCVTAQANERATGALVKAVTHNNPEAALQALIINADPETRQLGSNTLLTYAAFHNYTEIAKQLLDHGANVNRKDANSTPLHIACSPRSKGHDKLPLIQLLVSRGAQINQQDDNGHTPLTLAAKAGRLKVVEYLLNEGADPDIISLEGTALDIARTQSNLHLTLLIERAADKIITTKNARITQDLEHVIHDFFTTNLSGSDLHYDRNRTSHLKRKIYTAFKRKNIPHNKIPALIEQTTRKQNDALAKNLFINFRPNAHYNFHELTYNNKRARLSYVTRNPINGHIHFLFIMFHMDNHLWKIHDIMTNKMAHSPDVTPRHITQNIKESYENTRMHMR